MQLYWRKQLYKAADVVITLPPGHPAWPLEMFEPLSLLSFSLSSDIDLGSFADPSIFWHWEGKCDVCGETTFPGKDLFAATLGRAEEGFQYAIKAATKVVS